MGKLERIEENCINKKLILLKEQYGANSVKISELENQLKIKKDNLLREKLRDIKIFECLNAEKPTPLLLSLAKKANTNESVNVIKDSLVRLFLTIRTEMSI